MLIAMFGLNPLELLVIGLASLVPLGMIGAILYIAVRVSRLRPMQNCPHCGGKLRD